MSRRYVLRLIGPKLRRACEIPALVSRSRDAPSKIGLWRKEGIVGNVLRVFARDMKRLAKTPAAWVVALALIVLPSLYAWINVYGFWNPYDNTQALRVCVVNEDQGAHDDKLGELDLGAQIVDDLLLADLGQALGQLVGQADGQRH